MSEWPLRSKSAGPCPVGGVANATGDEYAQARVSICSSEDLAAVLLREIAEMLANNRNTRELLKELAAETRAPAADV